METGLETTGAVKSKKVLFYLAAVLQDFYKAHLLAVHTFMKVDAIEPKLLRWRCVRVRPRAGARSNV